MFSMGKIARPKFRPLSIFIPSSNETSDTPKTHNAKTVSANGRLLRSEFV